MRCLAHQTRLAAVALLVTVLHAQPALPEGARVLGDVAYVTGGHERQKLDLYLPADPKGPVLVYIHGGAWRAGSKAWVPGLEFLNNGWVLASVEYRLSQDALFPAQIQDCKAAVRWLRAHASDYGYNPNQIAAWGESAGGHLTALLAVTGRTREFDVGENLDQSSAIQCGIDFFGPTDFPGWKPLNANPMIQTEGPESALTQLLGGPLKEKLELARQASPVTWVDKHSAPLMILHGTRDNLVAVEQSRLLADKLQAAGVATTLVIIDGAGHGGPEFLSADRREACQAFIRHWTNKGSVKSSEGSRP